MKTTLKILSYVLVAVLASALTLGCVLGVRLLSGGEPEEVSKLEELKDLITERYIGGVEEKVLEDAAAEAMVAATGDRWSYYIPAEEYQAYVEQMANSYVGIGITIQITEEENGFLITKVNAGGPAEEAGLLAGDLITAIGDQSTAGMATAAARDLVRGEEGTQVEITLVREGKTMTVPVTRKTVEVEVATGVMLEGNIGLVTITNFDSRCAKETIAAIEKLLKEGATALIFDVRNNPGGYANQLVRVLDYLLPEGELFRTVDYKGNENVDKSDASCLKIPMAVLVNSESYSAAEFFAAALKDYDAAVIVGEKTCGKGYFQVNYPLHDGSAVSISIGEYFTPKGANLAGVGVTPDVEVAVDEDTFLAIYAGTMDPMSDPQILAAMAELQK